METDITADLQNRELLKRIEKYISSCPSEIQRIFRLHLYNDKTFVQISGILGLPEATVKSKFYRTIKKIKEVFGDEY